MANEQRDYLNVSVAMSTRVSHCSTSYRLNAFQLGNTKF